MNNLEAVIPQDVRDLYEVHDFQHAAAILSQDFPVEFGELMSAFAKFRLKEQWIKDPGGNESRIPKEFADFLRPSWKEAELEAKLVVTEILRKGKSTKRAQDGQQDTGSPEILEVIRGSHHIDFVKGKVAFDLEWNSKDQTFDRDLYAFGAFFEYGKIDVGVLLTRSLELDPYFKSLGTYIDPKNNQEKSYFAKYGASTTQMAQLLRRARAGRQGGCPLLVLGITTKLIVR